MKRWVILVLFLLLCGLFLAHLNDVRPRDANGQVWYEIMPERFYNGDPSNDPPAAYVERNLVTVSEDWNITPWTSDWYAQQSWEQGAFWDTVQQRRYGGDIQGIIDKLDYLKDLGVDVVYVTPLTSSPTYHKYDAAYLHHIDPYFGPNPMGDLALVETENHTDSKTWVWTDADVLTLRLINETHKRGMKIVFDGVFNHVGLQFFAFQDVIANKQNSSFADWFIVIDWNKMNSLGVPFEYQSWLGYTKLPEFREDDYGIVAKPRSYIFSSVKRWMDPNNDGDASDGIDGWRADVAMHINPAFWRDFNRYTKAINNNSILVGEVWESPEVYYSYLSEKGFDSLMNYPFGFAAKSFLVSRTTNASSFNADIYSMIGRTPVEKLQYQLNLVDSHDTPRAISEIINSQLSDYASPTYDHLTDVQYSPYNISGPSDGDIQKFKMLVALQMLFPGSPMIYYGDEVGMWGANDPDSRKPMVWSEFSYIPEQTLPNQSHTEPSAVALNRDVYAYYKKLIEFRHSSDAVRKGSFSAFLVDNSTYGFLRSYADATVVLVVNPSNVSVLVELSEKTIPATRCKDVLLEKQYFLPISVQISADSALVLDCS